jgi:hypothetical protein
VDNFHDEKFMGKCKSKKLFFRLIFIYYKEQAFKDLIMRFLPMVGMTVYLSVKDRGLKDFFASEKIL